MADLVFNDPAKLARLNSIVHPAVRKRFNEWCAQQEGVPYVVMEAAILAETGGAKAMDHLVVVTAPEELRIRRVMQREWRGREAEVRARMAAQNRRDATRNAAADTVIVNDDRALLIPQVLELHRSLSGVRTVDVHRLPLSTVTLVFGAGSVPLAFARQMVSLAVVHGRPGDRLPRLGALEVAQAPLFGKEPEALPSSDGGAGWPVSLRPCDVGAVGDERPSLKAIQALRRKGSNPVSSGRATRPGVVHQAREKVRRRRGRPAAHDGAGLEGMPKCLALCSQGCSARGSAPPGG
jgi:hypothetical protein